MNSKDRHYEKFSTKWEVKKMLRARNLSLLKVGHLFIVRGKLGSLFQSHDIFEVKRWIQGQGKLLTANIADGYCDEKVCPVKYGRVTTRP